MVKVTRRKMAKKKARKKRTVKRAKVGGSVTSRIQPISEVQGGYKVCLYGVGKTGKTRLACTFPKPLLLIGVAGFGTEKGTRSVSNVKGAKFVPLEHSEELLELQDLDEYASFVLDTAGGLQERVVNEFTGHKAEARKDWRHVSKGDWGPINSKCIERLRGLLDQADFKDKNVVIIAHERVFESEGEGRELITPHVSAALTPGVSGWLNGAADYVGQCFIRPKTKLKKIANKNTRIKVPGEVEYCLRVGSHPIYTTGFRVPIGVKLPDVIVDPTYQKIAALAEGKEVD